MDFGDALNKALREEMRRDPRVFCIGEDIVLGVPFGVTKGLCEEFGPERVLNAPLSEAAIVGAALGAAMAGLVPVVDMRFAGYVPCAIDEVRNKVVKPRDVFGGRSAGSTRMASRPRWWTHGASCPSTGPRSRTRCGARTASSSPRKGRCAGPRGRGSRG